MSKLKLALLCLLVSPLCGRAASTPPRSSLEIRNVTVINPGESAVLPHMTVEVADGKIVRVIHAANTASHPAQRKANSVDGTGKFLIPGLWDMHVHSAFGTWLPGGKEVILPLFVANGITGVRDMGSELDTVRAWKHDIAQGTMLGPRMVIAGPMLDGPVPRFPASVSIKTPEDARAAVDRLQRDGADFIKIQSLIPRDAFFAAADEAKKDRIVFAGHVPDAIRASEAATAGEKSIEHYTGVFEGCSSNEDALLHGPKGPRKVVESYDPERAKALIALFKREGTWQVPTLVWERGQWLIDKSDFSHPPLARYVPPYWRDKTWREFTRDILKDMDTDPIAYRERFVQMEMQMTLAMHKAGIPFMAGTDTAPGVWVVPGFSLHDELALFVQAGMTPMEALQTATSNPARYLGTERTMGSIAPGKVADLVLLNSDPVADIHATKKIAAVVLDGRYLSRADLDHVLEHVAEVSQTIQ
jgi:Amidohydrolase family